MKLVQLLAKKLKEWPEGAKYACQDTAGAYEGSVFFVSNEPEHIDGSGGWSVCGVIDAIYNLEVSSDAKIKTVTKSQWQDERDRQKGGEWKRHRGGKCPVPAGTKVSTRHRDGEVVDVHFQTAEHGTHKAVMDCVWKHDGSKHDIMAYKVISQPQAEEVEVNVRVDSAVNVEYAFGAPDADMSKLDWRVLGACNLDSIEFPTQGEIIHGPISMGDEVIAPAHPKWGQVDGPILWRDTVNELNAYIEEFTRERDELINRLALEGFALIPAMDPVMGFSPISLPFGEWEPGDLVTSKVDYNHQFTKGKKYKVTGTNMSLVERRVSVESDDKGKANGWLANQFEFHSRP